MSTSIGIINYAGPEPARRRSWFATIGRVIICLFLFVVLTIYVAVRAALLTSGFILLLIGTILLRLGGQQSARKKLKQWRTNAADLIRLWIDDILRPLRRSRATRVQAAQPVLLLP
jgi:uncharacterized membrane protein YjdF